MSVPSFAVSQSAKETDNEQPAAKNNLHAVYNREEVLKASTEYFGGDLLAANIVVNKYLLRDGDKFLERTPADMHDRLAREFARVEQKMNPGVDRNAYYQEVRSLLDHFRKVVPQGSPMAGIGNPYQLQSLSNCTVISSPEDSISGIFKTALEAAELYKRRAGVGIDLSTLRPSGSRVKNAALSSGGIPCFSDFYSYVTRMIGQSGRLGALMLTLDIKHPDAEFFATMKSDLSRVTGANVSLKLTDEFMIAVENGEEFVQQWPIDVPVSEAKIVKKIKAKHLWSIITKSAWNMAEPGLLMWDNYCNNLPAHNYPGFKTVSTNPCSELGLSESDSCRLISMNLLGYVKNPFTKEAHFDYKEYAHDVGIAQRMSDGLVELELEILKKIVETTDTESEKAIWSKFYDAGKKGRRTGLGTHALGDVLLALNLKYDSGEAIAEVDRIYETHKTASYLESVKMAKERGVFPIWDWEKEKDNEFIVRLPDSLKEDIKKYGRRNIANLTVAPTGSVSIMSQTSSGIEPVFRWVYDRRVKLTHTNSGLPVDFVDETGDKWTTFRVIHTAVKKYFEAQNKECPIKDGRDFSVPLDKANKLIQESLPKHFVTSDQIDYIKGVELQGALTKHLDHGASRTINLPKETTEEQVSEVYLKAWKLGLKGVTVYRDGCRDGVLLTDSHKSEVDAEGRPLIIKESHAPKRPKVLPAEVHHTKVRGTDWAVVVGVLSGKPYEVFAGRSLILPKSQKIEEAYIVKTGKKKYSLQMHIKGNGVEEIDDLKEIYDNPEQRVITRDICRELRHGVPVEFIVKDYNKYEGTITDFVAALNRILKKYAKRDDFVASGWVCKDCGSKKYIMKEGCIYCQDCGSGKCQ